MRARILKIGVLATSTVALCLVVAALIAGPPHLEDPTSWTPPEGIPPARPECDREVSAGADLQALVDEVAEGSVICLGPGDYMGPVQINRRVTIWGPTDAVVRSTGVGTTIDILADGSALLGLSVSGSGGRYDINDAAVRVSAADVRIEGLHIDRALFGILAEDATRIVVRGNEILGDPNSNVGIGMRGDGIRFWSTTDSLVEGNHVSWGRDVVVWYSANNRFVGNTVTHGRYGTHFMYSHDCVVEGNHYVSNVVGVFIMYTHGIRIEDNLVADQSSAGGLGLGLKDSGDITVRGNRFIHNRVSVHFDNSPSSLENSNLFEGNEFRLSEAAIVFHSSQHRNSFLGNSFRNNHVNVRVNGGGDAMAVTWEGNDFDDYAGYDLDGDGFGDRPYELRRLSSQLTSRQPQLAFLRGTPSLWLVDMASEVSPMLRPQTILVDERPRLRPLERVEEVGHAN